MSADDNQVTLGRIVGVHGVRGMVKIHSECRPRAAIFRYRHFLATPSCGGEPFALTLLKGHPQGQGLIAAFAEITDRDQALALKGHTLAVRRRDLPALTRGEYYWADLLGLQVINQSGARLGTVHELFETGANDVMVVRDGAEEILIPFVPDHYILSIDLPGRQITVDWEKDWLDS